MIKMDKINQKDKSLKKTKHTIKNWNYIDNIKIFQSFDINKIKIFIDRL